MPNQQLITAYNLRIQSDIALPELLRPDATRAAGGTARRAPDCEPDVFMRRGALAFPEHPPELPAGAPVRIIRGHDAATLLYWSGIGAFLVEDGRNVTVTPVPNADERLVRLVLTGPVLGVLLAQRGTPVFHASVVARPDAAGALAFLARSGEGKSTLAAAFYRAGYGMVSDDLMPLLSHGTETVALPGFPRAKLWAESAHELVEDAAALPQVGPGFEKRSCTLDERFCAHPVAVQAVYVLDRGAQIAIERLSGYQALAELLPHWYGALFAGQLMDILGRGRHFRECAELASRLPVFRLTRPFSYERLHDVVNAVDAHAAQPARLETTCR